jgi:hypothetical protein
LIECLILGDSIARGIAMHRPECVTLAQTGITSRDWNDTYSRQVKPAGTTIISLGSNDYDRLNTEVELVALRTRVKSGAVYWIVPANKPAKQSIVKKIAREFGDVFVTIPEVSKDGVHPTVRGYRQLGVLTR